MEKLKAQIQPYKVRFEELHQQYEKYVPATFFGLGFSFDILTLGEIDDMGNIISLAVYLAMLIGINFIDYFKVDWSQNPLKLKQKFYEYRVDVFHFSAGALLSAFTLFYFKSSSLANSFLFLVLMLSLLVLNEIELFQKQGLLLRSSIAMLCFVSYLVYIVPLIIGAASALIFYSCLILAFSFSVGAFFILTYKNQEKQTNIKQLLIPHGMVLLMFGILYSFKMVPPIPLSLKYIGVFHKVEKKNGDYITSHLNPSWKFWNNGDQNFTAAPGDRVYIFTKIFAPGGFAGKVFIHWLKETNDGLKTSDKIPLNITGGRAEGFRGHAFKANYTEGDWVVKIETDEGLEIGRINLTIEKTQEEHDNELKVVKR